VTVPTTTPAQRQKRHHYGPAHAHSAALELYPCFSIPNHLLRSYNTRSVSSTYGPQKLSTRGLPNCCKQFSLKDCDRTYDYSMTPKKPIRNCESDTLLITAANSAIPLLYHALQPSLLSSLVPSLPHTRSTGVLSETRLLPVMGALVCIPPTNIAGTLRRPVSRQQLTKQVWHYVVQLRSRRLRCCFRQCVLCNAICILQLRPASYAHDFCRLDPPNLLHTSPRSSSALSCI
jgi:hypothetical protein